VSFFSSLLPERVLVLGIMACIELPSRSLCIVISLGRLTPVLYVVKGVYITVNLVFLLGNSQAREEYDSRPSAILSILTSLLHNVLGDSRNFGKSFFSVLWNGSCNCQSFFVLS